MNAKFAQIRAETLKLHRHIGLRAALTPVAMALGIMLTNPASAGDGKEMKRRETKGILMKTFVSSLVFAIAALSYAQAHAGYGFVWADNPYAAFYEPSPSYSFNTGSTNSISRLGTGHYRVRFGGLGSNTGNVQVTSYGGGSGHCKVEQWFWSGADEMVDVRCFAADGIPEDNMYVVTFDSDKFSWAERAYLWNNLPSRSGTPDPNYQFVRGATLGTVTFNRTGNYTVRLPIGGSGTGDRGIAHVTAYGTDAVYCVWDSFTRNPTTVANIRVRCYDPSGAPANSMFSLSYGRYAPLEASTISYAHADQPQAASYMARADRSGAVRNECLPPSDSIQVTRNEVGFYTVSFPTFHFSPDFKDTVMVTANGSGARRCNVLGWFGTGSNTEVNVFCTDATGTALDSRFGITYATNEFCIE